MPPCYELSATTLPAAEQWCNAALVSTITAHAEYHNAT